MVGTDRDLLACSRYIEMNPVRAEMVVSQPAYLALATTPAARSAVYRAMFLEALPADTLARVRKSTEAGEVIGDTRFRAEIRNVLARRVARAGHGGDRRSVKFRERAHDQVL